MIELSDTQPDEHRSFPFLSCLKDDDLALLDAAIFYNHRRHLVKPAEVVDIIGFNPEKEMIKKPKYTAEARR